jgi:hypothetical protein
MTRSRARSTFVRRAWPLLLQLLSVALLVLPSSASGQLTDSQLSQLGAVVESNKGLAIRSGNNVGIFDIAINRLQRYNHLQHVYDSFFEAAKISAATGSSGLPCRSQPEESVQCYYIPVEFDQLKDFLQSSFVKSMPKNVQDKMSILQYMHKPTILSDVFARMYVDTDPSTGAESEKFEIGHTVIKAFYDKDTVHVMILTPSLKSSIDSGCSFDPHFRDTFIGRSQDIQSWIAIKAAENKDFSVTLGDFSEVYAALTPKQLEERGRYQQLFDEETGRKIFVKMFGTSTTLSTPSVGHSEL